jgi:hypothetical protein
MTPAWPCRVVTGHDADGRSVIETHGTPPLVLDMGHGGPVFYEIWRTEDPALGRAFEPERPETSLTLGPPRHGTRIRLMDIPPETAPMSREKAQRHFEAIGGADALSIDPEAPHPLMHRTASVDYAIILAGELVLILDTEERALGVGDVVVQRGTNHAWANRSDRSCRVAFILTDQPQSNPE